MKNNSNLVDIVAKELKDFGLIKTFIDTWDFEEKKTQSYDGNDVTSYKKSFESKYVTQTQSLDLFDFNDEVILSLEIVNTLKGNAEQFNSGASKTPLIILTLKHNASKTEKSTSTIGSDGFIRISANYDFTDEFIKSNNIPFADLGNKSNILSEDF